MEVSGLRSQVSALSSLLSCLGSRVSVLESQDSGLRSHFSGLRSQVSGLRPPVSEVIDHPSFDVHNTLAGAGQSDLGSPIDIRERVKKVKRMTLATVSASGTPTVTNLSFWLLRAFGTSRIGILTEK